MISFICKKAPLFYLPYLLTILQLHDTVCTEIQGWNEPNIISAYRVYHYTVLTKSFAK